MIRNHWKMIRFLEAMSSNCGYIFIKGRGSFCMVYLLCWLTAPFLSIFARSRPILTWSSARPYIDQCRRLIMEEVKFRNIIDMAFWYTVMGRLFEEGQATVIKQKLLTTARTLIEAESKEEFDDQHKSFCHWMMKNIQLRPTMKQPHPSFGHCAKILDITMKVLSHYCHYGNPAFVNSAIDNQFIKHLKKKYGVCSHIKNLGDIDEPAYEELQQCISREIEEDFDNQIMPVQYDDIMWERLNR